MAAMLVSQNNETPAMLVYQTNLAGVKLFSYVSILSFVPKNHMAVGHVSEMLYLITTAHFMLCI